VEQHGTTGKTALMSDSSFNNVTIKSVDKYNSTLGAQAAGAQINSSGGVNQSLVGMSLQTNHPLSAKNAKKKKANPFTLAQHTN